MAKKWSDVAASSAFQALSFDEQEEARRQYFEQVVAPRVPTEDLDLARSQFLTQTELRRPANDSAAPIDYTDAATAMLGAPPSPPDNRGLIQRVGDFFRPQYKSVLEGYQATPQERQAEIDKRLSYGAGPISQETMRQADVVRSTRGTRDAVAPANRQVAQVVQKMDERGEQSFGDLIAIARKDEDLKRIEAELEAEGRQRFGKENPILGSIAAGSAGLISGFANIPSVAADAFNQVAVNPVLRALGLNELPRAPTAFGTEYLTKAASDYMPKIGKQEMSVAIARDEFAPWLMSKLAANSPQIAQSLAAAFVPPLRAVLLPGMAGTAAGQSYVEGDDSRVAVAKGLVEYASEKLPLGVFDKVGDMLKGMSPVKANTVLAVAGQRALQAGGAITANTLTNAIEETVAQLGGNVLDKYFQGKDIELTKGLAESALIGGVTGTALSTPQAAAAATGYYDPNKQIAREIDAAGRAFDRVGEAGSQAVAIDMLRTEPGSSNLISPAATVTNFTPPSSPTKQAGMVDIEVPVPNTPPALPEINTSTEQEFGLDRLRMGGTNVGTAGTPGGLAAGSGQPGGGIGAGGLDAAGRGAVDAAGTQAGTAGGVRANDRSALPAGGEAGQPAAGVAPAEIWTGRRGDGYTTEADAAQALPGRQRKYPDLTWSVEQMPGGKFRLAGYSQETTLGTQTDQAAQGQAQGTQAQAPGAAAAQAGAAATQVELSDSERAGLKLALPAPAPTFAAVQEQLAKRRGVTVEAVPVAELNDSQRLASTVARLLGNTLTVVRATSGDTTAVPNGFINRLGGKHIFVDSKADDAPVSIALHEGLHSLPAERRKTLNTALLEVFNQDQKGEFLREFGYTADKFDEEAPAMMAQAISKRADFWEELRDKMGNREFGEVAKVILTKLNQVITGAKDQYGEAFVNKYIKDVVKARDLLTTAYAESMQAQGFKPDTKLVETVASEKAITGESFLRATGFKDSGPAEGEWVMPVSKLGDVVARVVSAPGEPVRMEISADYMGRRFGTRTAEGEPAIKEAIAVARDGIQQGREKLASQFMADERGLPGDTQPPALMASNRAEQKNAAASRIEDVSADRFKRTPALQQALADLQEGKITRAEYSKVVDEARPVYPYKELPEITPAETARFALANGRGQSAEKAAKYGLPNKELTQGEMVQLRLDIPSYQEHDAWVVTVHRPKTTNRSVQAAYDAGPTVGYESVASITNATFGMRQSSAMKIAQGTSKGTIATVLGEWKPITPAEAKVKAQAAMKSGEWTQVGMDPFRHSYFYDRDTMRPVVAADEVIQVGPLVLAKNAKFDDELDVTGAPLMFSEKVVEPETIGEFTYTQDERGGITVTGDAERIKFLTRKVTNAKVKEDGTVSFGAKFAKDALDALRAAPKVNPEIAQAISQQLGLTNAELASTSLAYQTGKPKDLAFVAPLQGGIPETVRFLEERRRASGLRLLDIANPRDQDTLARLIAAETLAAIRSSGNALEWYDETIAKTLAMAAVKYPELAKDANAQMVFRLAMAITSQGLNVENNLKFTMRQYDAYRRTGKYPEVGEGDSSQAMVSNFKLANELIAEMTPDLFRRFLVTPFTIGELNSAGFEPGGELVDETVLGSSVFGPKIGFGFYSNLNGNFEPVTMDMWFMRTIGRLIGRLRSFDAEKFGGQLERFRGAFDERGTDGVYADRFDAALIERARTDQDAAIELARQVKKAHERDFKENRAAFDAKTRKKSSLVLAAETMIQSVDKPKDVPGNGTERRQLREVVRKAVAEVERVYGQRIPPAAMQALIWYPEQELYKAMGVKLSVTSQDYAGATEKVLTEEGYDAKRLRTAAQSGARRVRQANARDVGRAAQGNGQAAGRSGPLETGERAEFLRTRYERTELAKERVEPKRKSVIFEVAPDPNNEGLTNAWRTLSQEQRLAISERVARTIVPRVLSEFNTDGIISPQVGSYLDDTNPSFSLLLNKGDVLDVSRALGFVLAQDSMMVVSPKPFKGGIQVGAIFVNVGDKSSADIDEVYQKLREIRVNGEQPVGGQSYANGRMIILNYSDVSTDQLAILIDQKLNKGYSVETGDVYSAFPEKKEYDYASEKTDPRGGRADLRRRARALRAEATAALEAELRGEGIEFSRKVERAEAAGQAERITDLEPADVLRPDTIAAAEAAIAKYKQPDKPDPLTKEQRLKGELMLKPMFQAARKNKPEFDNNLRRIADEVNGFAKTPGIKKPMRAVTKLVTEMDGNASKMKDLLRGTIVVGDAAAAQAAIDKIGEVYRFDRIKNRMGADIVSPDGSTILPETMPTGYQDILTNVILDDGTIAEIQLTTPEMAAAKHLGHEVYAFEREMPASAVKDEMVALQVRIYSEGRAAFDSRQATQSSYRDSNTSRETSPAFSRTSEGLRGEGSGTQAVAEDMSAGVVTGTSSQSKNRVPSGSVAKSNGIEASAPSITKPMEEGEIMESRRLPKVSPQTQLNRDIESGANVMEAAIERVRSGRPVANKLLVGRLPHVLNMLGARTQDFDIARSIVEKVFDGKHRDEFPDIKPEDLVRAMYRPAMVFKSKDGVAREFELVLPITNENGAMLVPIKVSVDNTDPTGAVMSIYNKRVSTNLQSQGEKTVMRRINDGNLVYVDPLLAKQALTGRKGSDAKANENFVSWPGVWPKLQKLIADRKVKTDIDLMRWIGDNFDPRTSPAGFEDAPAFSNKAAAPAMDKEVVSLFKDLQDSRGLGRIRVQERVDAHPMAETIRQIDKDFMDILERLDDAGLVKINCK